MATERIDLVARADVQDFARGMREAERRVKSLAKELDINQSQARKVIKRFDAVEGSAKKMTKGTNRAKAGVEGLRKSAEAIQGPMGGMISRVVGAGEAVASFGGAAGAAAIPVAALAAGILAPAGAAVAMDALTSAAIRARKELDKHREQGARIAMVNDDLAASVTRYEMASDDLTIATAELTEVLGTQLAPGAAVVKTLLAAATHNAAAFGRSVQGLYTDITAVIPVVNDLVDGFRALTGIDALSTAKGMRATTDSLKEIQAATSRVINDTAQAALDEEWSRVTASLQSHNATADKTVEKIQKITTVTYEARNAISMMQTDLNTTIESLEATGDTFDSISADLGRWIEAYDRARAQHVGAATDILGSFTSTVSSVNQVFGEQSREVFFATQALRVAEATINATAAASMALANPPGPPATIPIAAAAFATGIANVAQIAAVSPPEFHTGGSLGRRGPNAPDEQMARLRRNEVVMTRQQMQAMQSPAVPEIAVRFKHRTLDRITADVINSPGSRTSRAVRRGDRVGHARRR